MDIVGAKLKKEIPSDFMSRQRVEKKLHRMISQNRFLLLEGFSGSGKTMEVLSFARKYYREHFGYYCLDVWDNAPAQFQTYFLGMLECAGMIDQPDQLEKPDQDQAGWNQAGGDDFGEKAFRGLGNRDSKSNCILYELFEKTAIWFSNKKEPWLLIFDQMECLRREDIREGLSLFLTYLPENVSVLFIADTPLISLNSPLVKKVSAEIFSFTRTEFSGYLKKLGYDFSAGEQELLWKRTGGKIGLGHIFLRYLDDGMEKGKIELSVNTVALRELDEIIGEVIWRPLHKKYKKMLCYGSLVSSVSALFYKEAAGLEVSSGELLCGMRFGIFSCRPHPVFERDSYEVQEWMRQFILRNHLEGERTDTFFHERTIWHEEEERKGNPGTKQDTFLNRAAIWYEEREDFEAAVDCLLKREDGKRLCQFMRKHRYKCVHLLTMEKLKACLRVFESRFLQRDDILPEKYAKTDWCEAEETDILNIFFWQGVWAVWIGDGRLLEEKEGEIQSRMDSYGPSFSGTEGQEHEKGSNSLWEEARQLLLNLYYMDYRISSPNWLERTEEISSEYPVFLYDVTGNTLDIRCGIRDLTPFFLEGGKLQKEWERRFRRAVSKKQGIYFEISAIDYLLETERGKQALENFWNLLPHIRYQEQPEVQAGSGGLLCKLYQQGYLNEDIWGQAEQALDKQKGILFPMQLENMEAAFLLAKSCFGSIYGLSHWFEEKKNKSMWPTDEVRETNAVLNRESHFLWRMRAENYYRLRNYKKAECIYGHLAVFYRQRHWKKQEAQVLFGQAASLFEKSPGEALKLATQSLSIGAPFHYISIYTGFGEIGLELLCQYQNLVMERKDKITAKKHYYYGNILRATFEEYQDILLRSAKKEARRMGKKQQEIPEPLTKTERRVLEVIKKGYSNQQIAKEFGVKLSTVKTHISGIYRKLDVKNRVEAIKKGEEEGLL